MVRLDDVTAAWMAGIVEGEGCIRIQVCSVRDWRTKQRLKDRATMSMCVCMKDYAVVDRFRAIGGHFYVRGDGCANWTLSSRPAMEFLKQIEPFMVGEKKPQARLAIEFQEGRTAGRRSPERYEYEMAAARRIAEMKNVGVYARKKPEVSPTP